LILRIAALLALASTLSYGAADTTAPKKSSTAPTKKSTKSKTAHESSSHAKTTAKSGKTTAKTGTAASRKSRSSKTAAKRGKGSHSKSAQAWRSRQLAPTPDRYKEIQSALAQRGYLKKDPSGVWDTESADAMRRFQHDQNLEATGKLNSLSLMALGLGAKHGDAPAAAPVRTAPPAPVTPGPLPAPPPVATPETPAADPPAAPLSGPTAPAARR
jgi:hypothetical protein